MDESFGLTAVEAAFFEVPVVATRRGGLPEIVIEGSTGFLVNSESPRELADRLLELISNGQVRRTMGTAARKLR